MKQYQKIKSNPSLWFDATLMLLACVAGSTDILSYFRLGNVFTANMTGNIILLGISIGQGALSTSLYRLISLFGFIMGVFIGALIVVNKKRGWLYNVTIAVGIESIMIGSLTIIWLLHSKPLESTVLYIGILLSAVSMGIQSAAIWHLKIPGVVTTFLTGNITSLATSLTRGLRQGFTKKIKSSNKGVTFPGNLEDRITIQLMVLFMYIFSAIFTGWLEYHNPGFLPLLPLLLILCVFAILVKHLKIFIGQSNKKNAMDSQKKGNH